MTTKTMIGMQAFVAAGLFGFGCGDEQAMEPPAAGTQVAAAELLGSVQLSPTHDVKFWDYGNGLARIEENLDADLDRDATLTLNKLHIDGHPLADVYQMLAGTNGDAIVADRLHTLDLRIAAVAAQEAASPSALPEGVLPGHDQLSTSATAPQAAANAAAPAATGDVDVRQSGLACAEPAWDWQGDVGWFKNNYCGNDAWDCTTMVTWATWGFYGWLSYYRSAGYDTSFCTTANYTVQARLHGGFPSYGITVRNLVNTVLQPRKINDSWWTATGDVEFYSGITSGTGANPVGLAIHQVVR